MSIRAISFTGMKRANRLSVLRLARAAGPISRADIADRTGLTPSTVANAVNELLAKGLLRVGETAPSEGGRRPVLVEFNEKHAYVVGVNVGFTVIVAVVTDLSGRIVGRFALPTLPEEGPTPVMERVVTAIKRAIENARVPFGRIKGVGVGIPGLVDLERGESVFSPNMGWEKVAVRTPLEENLGRPVLVDNDIRLATFGEWRYGAGIDSFDFASLYVGTGIGSAFVVRGALHYGATASAGEIGHTVVDPDGPECSCGKYGCLEAVASGRAIARAAVAEIKRGRKTSLIDGADPKDITAARVASHAARGDLLSLELMEKTGRYLGTAVAMIVNTVNPSVVAVGGGVSQAGPLIFKPMQESFFRYAVEYAAKRTRIVPAQLGKDAGPKGAAGHVIESLFNSEGRFENMLLSV